MIDHIQWLGHGSFIIQGPPLIYINPWRVVRSVSLADVILISHNHYDHCSETDIAKVCGPHTRIIGNALVAKEIENCTVIRPWQSVTADRACIKALPAYSPNDWRHPLEDGGLGFIISVNLHDIYYAGDTQIIPEMRGLRPDIAILPIDGNGTLNVAEAAELVRQMRPRWAIPSNWGPAAEGATRLDALAFRQQTADITETVILPLN